MATSKNSRRFTLVVVLSMVIGSATQNLFAQSPLKYAGVSIDALDADFCVSARMPIQ